MKLSENTLVKQQEVSKSAPKQGRKLQQFSELEECAGTNLEGTQYHLRTLAFQNRECSESADTNLEGTQCRLRTLTFRIEGFKRVT